MPNISLLVSLIIVELGWVINLLESSLHLIIMCHLWSDASIIINIMNSKMIEPTLIRGRGEIRTKSEKDKDNELNL